MLLIGTGILRSSSLLSEKHLGLAGRKFTGRFGLILTLLDVTDARSIILLQRWAIVASILNHRKLRQVVALVDQ